MPRYKPSSRARHFLRRLAAGPASRWDLYGLQVKVETEARRFSQSKDVLRAMRKDGLVTFDGMTFSVTDAGLRALERLEAGEAIDTGPNARVFATRSAA